jgi:2-polyprenyl-3-methyl-5-hydroxy-6-metoxy-1,4-benzoquinol methylase
VFTFSECRECDCLFLNPMPGVNELASFYPRQYWWNPSSRFLKALENFYRRIVLRDHVAFIRKSASEIPGAQCAPTLLEVGCGVATLLGLLKKRGFCVLGMDSSEEAAALAKVQSGVDVVVGSRLNDVGFEAASFDLVTLFHVIEHIPDPREVLAEVRRILQPKGRVIVQVPNRASWQSRLCGARWSGLDVPRHVIQYSTQSMRRLLAGEGFHVRRTRHFNLRDNAPALASSLFPALDPISRRGKAEPGALAWMKHAAYAAAVIAAYPAAIAEAWAGRGATVMLEAEKA